MTLSVDQRGHGQSAVSVSERHFSPLTLGADLLETIQEFQKQQNLTHLSVLAIGHSMGVRAVSALGHLAPHLIRGLILVDLGFSGLAQGGLGDSLLSFFPKLPHDGFLNRESLKNFLTQNCPDESIARYLNAASLPNPVTGRIEFPFQAEALMQIIEQSKASTVRGWVRDCAEKKAEILVLRGAESKVLPKQTFEQERLAFLHYSNVKFEEYANAGHGLPFDQKDRFVNAIRAMAQKLTDST